MTLKLKNLLKLALFLFAAAAIIPAAIFFFPKEDETVEIPAQLTPVADETEPLYLAPNTIRIKDSINNTISAVKMKDYVIGAVMAEMPASFPAEALKAQAAAIHTYAIREAVKNAEADFDVTNDSGTYIPYWNETQGRHFYTDGYDEAYKKIEAAVDIVFDKALVYQEEPIAAAFCSMSSGKTESAANIWGADLPYLQPVASPGDTAAPDFESSAVFTLREMKARIETETGATLGDNPADWFYSELYSPSGTLLEVTAGDTNLTGVQLREILNLRSANITIEYDNLTAEFILRVKGYGHGVGLSQYGAKAMAEDGKTWDEIVRHYYSNIEIVRLAA
jgi:stage II sporulation protein D